MLNPLIVTYIWLDARGRFRSKVRVIPFGPVPAWNYDGSSTGQATTDDSEITLQPLMTYIDAQTQHRYVLCETYRRDGTPTLENMVHGLRIPHDLRVAFEQEFFVFSAAKKAPVGGWPTSANPQGPYYCSVGAEGNHLIAPFVEEVFARGLRLGLHLTGWNLEVAPAQGEIQVDAYGLQAAHDLIMLRYLLWDTLSRHGLYPVFDPKPLGPDWNGSGLHMNVSTGATMGPDGWRAIERLLTGLTMTHQAWMPLFGAGNEARLTGQHETSSMDRFTWGIGSRATSVRVPLTTWNAQAGYIEDRRPAANADPYLLLRLYSALLIA